LTGVSAEPDSKDESDSSVAQKREELSSSDSDSSSSSGSQLIPNNPEARYREVFAVPLARRPLFPGGIMPVMVSNNTLIKEIIETRRQG